MFLLRYDWVSQIRWPNDTGPTAITRIKLINKKVNTQYCTSYYHITFKNRHGTASSKRCKNSFTGNRSLRIKCFGRRQCFRAVNIGQGNCDRMCVTYLYVDFDCIDLYLPKTILMYLESFVWRSGKYLVLFRCYFTIICLMGMPLLLIEIG